MVNSYPVLQYSFKTCTRSVLFQVTGALNCAPTGISSLNLDVYTAHGITYGFTNVSQDAYGFNAGESFEQTKKTGDCCLEAGKLFHNEFFFSGCSETFC